MESDISFIGLGQMGYGMATNLRKKMSNKSTLFINDVNKSACEKFVKENNSYGPIKIVDTAKDVASKAPILISMVPAAQHVKQVYLDKENGVIATTPDENRLILESSTIDVDTTREVGQAIMDAGVGRYIDAPVSGGVKGAAGGVLAFMIGCPDSDSHASRVREVVAMMAHPDKIFLCGQLGNGLASKISNNYMSGTVLVALAEAMAIGIRSGVDKKVLAEVIRNSSGNSWMGENLMPVPGIVPTAPSSNGYKPSFRHELMIKDLTLGIDAAKKVGIESTMGNTAVEHAKRAAQDPRIKDLDFTSTYIAITDGKNME